MRSLTKAHLHCSVHHSPISQPVLAGTSAKEATLWQKSPKPSTLSSRAHNAKPIQKSLNVLKQTVIFPKPALAVSSAHSSTAKAYCTYTCGHINQSQLEMNEANPLILSGKHHSTTLLVDHHHAFVKRQGRHFVEGAMRGSGLWKAGARWCNNSIIHRCVTRRKLCGKIEQQMSHSPPWTTTVQYRKLKHIIEVLITLMAEVTALANVRPLVLCDLWPTASPHSHPPLYAPHSENRDRHSPSLPPSEFTIRDLLSNQWYRVQALAVTFWARWRCENPNTLQSHQKWKSNKTNLKKGDVVLMKDSRTKRNKWPMQISVKVIPVKMD